jgi:predicted nucleic acid-binding protein
MLPGSETLRDVLPNGRASWLVLAVAAIVAVTILVLRDRAARRRAHRR